MRVQLIEAFNNGFSTYEVGWVVDLEEADAKRKIDDGTAIWVDQRTPCRQSVLPGLLGCAPPAPNELPMAINERNAAKPLKNNVNA